MEIRERIIDEANRQFFKYGIRHVRMDDIANSLAISKRTLYEIFKDKNELIAICMQTISNKQEARHQELLAQCSNVIEMMVTMMQEAIKVINSINPVFFSDLKKYYPKMWEQKHSSYKDRNLNNIHIQLRKGVNEGLFRKDINIKLVSKLFYEQANLIGDDDIFPKDEYSFVELFQNLMINFIRGISTRKGIDVVDNLLDQRS